MAFRSVRSYKYLRGEQKKKVERRLPTAPHESLRKGTPYFVARKSIDVRLEKLEKYLEVQAIERSWSAPDCICFPKDPPPHFFDCAEQEIALALKCPIHGNRFEPETFMVYTAGWKRDNRVKNMTSCTSQYKKAWTATFPPDLWCVEEVDGRVYFRLKDRTALRAEEFLRTKGLSLPARVPQTLDRTASVDGPKAELSSVRENDRNPAPGLESECSDKLPDFKDVEELIAFLDGRSEGDVEFFADHGRFPEFPIPGKVWRAGKLMDS